MSTAPTFARNISVRTRAHRRNLALMMDLDLKAFQCAPACIDGTHETPFVSK